MQAFNVRPLNAKSRPETLTTPLSVRARSEEHTSELQSLRHLVCRLLLEKTNEYALHKAVAAVQLPARRQKRRHAPAKNGIAEERGVGHIVGQPGRLLPALVDTPVHAYQD